MCADEFTTRTSLPAFTVKSDYRARAVVLLLDARWLALRWPGP